MFSLRSMPLFSLPGLCLLLVLAMAAPRANSQEQAASPQRYELFINGENFVVELGDFHALESKIHAGKKYQVALRVAQYQPWQLNSVEFDYHRGFQVTDDGRPEVRTASLTHPLGFAMIVTDLGGPLKEGSEQDALKLLVDLAVAEVREAGGESIRATKPSPLKLGDFDALRVGIQYQQQEVDRRSLAYVLYNQQASATILIEYVAADQEDVLPIVQPTLSSLRPH